MWLKLWLKREKKKEATDYQQLPFFLLSGLLDSNQRPRAPQTCALPTALNPDPISMLSTDSSSNAGAKLHTFCEIAKFLTNFFLLSYNIIISRADFCLYRLL